MIYIGIDNGSSGGIAALNQDGTVFRVDAMPPTDVDILAVLQVIASQGGAIAMLEHAQAFPKMGVSSAFNYGKGYGAIQMALAAAGIRFDIVVPRKWQGALSCLSGGNKNLTKARAQQLFPGTKITHAIADALLIAEHCRRVHSVTHESQSQGVSNGKAQARTPQGQGTEEGRTEAEGIEERRQRRRKAIADGKGEESPF